MSPRPPGLLRPDVQPDVVMMLCTAGHVDHGKTRLVKLLTGCATDRLKVEQERGLTIELGFAPCFLGDGLCVGIVDVPGHERFVRTMVAGVSGISTSIMVIAADDGIMPQTVEHFQIMELLGVRHGIIALTKTDLVTPEIVVQRELEIQSFAEGTFLEGAPICPVSSETFDGYPEFYDTVVAHVRALSIESKRGLFRMPIERVFRQAGFGTVLTGIPVEGTIAIGDRLEVVPGGETGRVRGIQRFLRDADHGGAGQCLALNVAELGKEAPVRGQVVTVPGAMTPSRFLHARIKTVPGLSRPLRNAEEVRFHSGTADIHARLYLLSDKALPSGTEGRATVALAEPVAVRAGDRFILRRFSPQATVAGGEVLFETAGKQRPRKKELVRTFDNHARLFGEVRPGTQAYGRAAVMWHLLEAGLNGLARGAVALRVGMPDPDAKACLEALVADGKVKELGAGLHLCGELWECCRGELRDRLSELSGQRCLSVTVGELLSGRSWPTPLWHALRDELVAEGVIRMDGSRVILTTAEDDLAAEDRFAVGQILQLYRRTGYASPRAAELPDLTGCAATATQRALEVLLNAGKLVKLSPTVILSRKHFEDAVTLAVETIRAEGGLDSGDFKRRIQSTRKYALAILDEMDARRITLRAGNVRRLTAAYEKTLDPQ